MKYIMFLLLSVLGLFSSSAFAWDTNMSLGYYNYSFELDSCSSTADPAYCSGSSFDDEDTMMFGVSGYSGKDGFSYGYNFAFGKHSTLFGALRYNVGALNLVGGYGLLLLTDPPAAKYGNNTATFVNSDNHPSGYKLGADYIIDASHRVSLEYMQFEFDTVQLYPVVRSGVLVHEGINAATVTATVISLNWQYMF